MPLNSPIRDIPSGASPGILYIVATPIGNRDDITLRALKILQQVDCIAAEDTRHTARFLAHHGIRGNLISCHEHNEKERTPGLIRRLQQGQSLALVSSAGTPSVSDPGYRLVVAAVRIGIKVVPIPGASAAVTALSAAGLPTDSFVFEGFPAKKAARRRHQLEKIADESRTVIFYESPRRITALLRELIETGGDRYAVLGRELTKLHEEFLRGSLSEILALLKDRPAVRGECTLLVTGRRERSAPGPQDFHRALREGLLAGDRKLSRLAREISLQFGVPRHAVYQEGLDIKSEIEKSG